jgi:hypothetical protein
MRRTHWLLALIAVGAAAGAHASDDIGWQEAVARLAQERTQAETCVRVLKTYGDAAAIDRGAIAYADAKAEYDAIIAGLDVAVADQDKPNSLPDLDARLKRGFDKREAFCKSVAPLAPPPKSGEKGPIAEIVNGAVGPLIDAVKSIWLEKMKQNQARWATIETQLEETKWPSFASISRSS